jgi:hypothetical protein
MKNINRMICAAVSVLALASCQKQIIERRQEGTLSLLLENSPVVEVLTKAEEDTVSPAEFDVLVRSEDASFSYVYKDMPPVITVPVGIYTVSAENITEDESLTLPDSWGQVRYAGTTEPKMVEPGLDPTQFSLTCTMVNTAVSVTFDKSIIDNLKDYTLTAYTAESRKLVYDSSNTSGETPAVGYFTPDAALNYQFHGLWKDEDETESLTLKGSKAIVPASHLHLTFKLSRQNGGVLKPEIVVDATCEDLYETITIDPTE